MHIKNALKGQYIINPWASPWVRNDEMHINRPKRAVYHQPMGIALGKKRREEQQKRPERAAYHQPIGIAMGK